MSDKIGAKDIKLYETVAALDAKMDDLKESFKEVKETMTAVKTNIESIGCSVTKIDTGFNNHLIDHKKTYDDRKWIIGTSIAAACAVAAFVNVLLRIL